MSFFEEDQGERLTNNLHHPVLRYGFAVASIAAGIGVRLLLDAVLGDTLPYATLFVAVMLTAWYGGLRPAMVAVVLGALAADYFLLAPRGSLLWADLSVQVGLLLYLATGLGIALFGGAMHDANERAETSAAALRKANEQLEARVCEAEARLNSTLAAASIGTWSWDIVNDRLVADEFTARMFSIEADAAAKGLPVEAYFQALFEEDRPLVADALASAIQSSGHYDIEYRVRLKDGEFRWLQARGRVEADGSGKAVHLHGAVMDITERKQAYEAMQASELRYRRLFESAKDGILILNADNGRIVDVNPYLIEMLGFSKEKLAGKALWEIGVFNDVLSSKAAFVELQEKGYIRYEDLPLKTHDGHIKQVEFVSNSYQAGGLRVIQCNIRDITERKHTEAELTAANQRLERALAELTAKRDEIAGMTQQLWQASKLATMGELAASIAHELNNPLATVGLRTENLLMQMPADPDKRKPLEIISQEVDRMASLVNNLLEFSRRSHREISTVNPGEEIATSVEFVHYYLQSHDIEVVTEFAAGLPTIQADRQQLRQLFLNLLTNATDAMPQGGKVTLRVVASNLGDAKAVAVEFADTGEGITAENLLKIWEPFFSTKPEGKGTGLGLAICRRIVEEHGGTIDIQSQAGHGTTFRIVLPATNHGASS